MQNALGRGQLPAVPPNLLNTVKSKQKCCQNSQKYIAFFYQRILALLTLFNHFKIVRQSGFKTQKCLSPNAPDKFALSLSHFVTWSLVTLFLNILQKL